jgi:hypothetical protein
MPISLSEVEDDAMHMPPVKAQCHDGFTTDFFHHYLYTVKNDVWALVCEPQRISRMLPTLNTTLLTLIPKEEKVVDPNQFHPITLYNVIYKIITKVISSHLKPLMPLLIGHE